MRLNFSPQFTIWINTITLFVSNRTGLLISFIIINKEWEFFQILWLGIDFVKACSSFQISLQKIDHDYWPIRCLCWSSALKGQFLVSRVYGCGSREYGTWYAYNLVWANRSLQKSLLLSRKNFRVKQEKQMKNRVSKSSIRYTASVSSSWNSCVSLHSTTISLRSGSWWRTL